MTVCLVLECVAITPPNAAGDGACIEFAPADVDTFQPKGAGSFTLPVRRLGYLEHFQVGGRYSFGLDEDNTRWLQRQARILSSGSAQPLDGPSRPE